MAMRDMTKKALMREFSSFVVTGKTITGVRFRKEYDEPQWAFGINLWAGSVWGVSRRDGKRKLLKRVWAV